MAKIVFDNGKTVEFDGTPSPQDVEEVANKLGFSSPQASTPEPSLLRKGWDALAAPEQFVKKGSEELVRQAKSTPDFGYTGNTVRDIALNAPKAINESVAETIDKVIPGTVSRGSLLSMGALEAAPAVAEALSPVGKWIGNNAEKLSGLSYKTPGVLTEAFKDPSLIFSKGVEGVRKMYESAKQLTPAVRQEFNETLDKAGMVEKAIEAAKDGSLSPLEALEARKTLDSMRKKVSDVAYRYTRDLFDSFAKQNFAEADQAYQRGVRADNMRNVFPLNKSGTPSIFKIGAGGALARYAGNPELQAAGLAMSPGVQGLAASGAGLVGKGISALAETPIKSGAAVGSILDQIFRKK